MKNLPSSLDAYKYYYEDVPFNRARLIESLALQYKDTLWDRLFIAWAWAKTHPKILTIIAVLLIAPIPKVNASPKPHTEPTAGFKSISLLHTIPKPKIEYKPSTKAKIYIPPPKPAPQTYNGTGDYYLNWIIQHESGGNPYAVNEIGACGLGQSLPCSKVLSVCGSLSNVSCQVEWVRNYCITSYGSTYNAWLHWQVYGWY